MSILEILLCSILWTVSSARLDLGEGALCFTSLKVQGKCVLITSCQSVMDDVKNFGKYPSMEDTCGFKGLQTVICCPDEFNVSSKIRAEPENLTVGTKCRQMCRKYADFQCTLIESPTLSLLSYYTKDCKCPFEREPLIVGGSKSSRMEFPHMAQVGYNREKPRWYCGGTLIAENFVLTAAHCLWHNQHGKPVKVRAGMTNLHDTSNMQVRDVLEVISHPTYKGKYNDIGLLKISSFEMNTYVRPACLHTTQSIPSKRAIASGWGNTEFSGSSSDDLQKVVLEFYSVDKCNQTYRREINQPGSSLGEGIRDDIMVCAGSSEYVRDTCQCNMARTD
ncbi:unnamed protein product [Acanthoscelides obtectus]|uniref:Peptidase S1 domain-containing protein n=1 Tax=Acanthoscelides obtectus TaxID=200917 RepID=A0A9P0KJB9_ACAOB|nr:unnamed protein product [Acanthoscelides obtectus]CAK1639574.1 Serine protease snake [Acanthoscelides obtectus]